MQSPSFVFEEKFWKQGYLVAGVDEVGRGSLAGPVAAGCVVFSPFQTIPENIYIHDSKKLSARERGVGSLWIQKAAFSYGFGMASQSVIDLQGIIHATQEAIINAVKSLTISVDFSRLHILIDGAGFPNLKKNISCGQTAIIRGDQKSFSVSSASILAKVYRDNLMQRLGRKLEFKKYKWGENKGYGTRDHIEAIKKYGVSRLHRVKFVRNIV